MNHNFGSGSVAAFQSVTLACCVFPGLLLA